MGDSMSDESRRLAELLSLLVRLSRRSRRSIEEELGLGSSALSKILGGTVRLQVTHVLEILAVLEVDPGDFFRVAYPRRHLRQSPLLERARSFLQPEDEEAGGEEGFEELPEFQERVRRVLLQLLSGEGRARRQDPS
jgi:transcriptional regulator with XRE-family HTH domain